MKKLYQKPSIEKRSSIEEIFDEAMQNAGFKPLKVGPADSNEILIERLNKYRSFIIKQRDEAEKEYKKYFEPSSGLDIHLRALFQGMSLAYQTILDELSKIPWLSGESSVIPQYIKDYFNKPEEERVSNG